MELVRYGREIYLPSRLTLKERSYSHIDITLKHVTEFCGDSLPIADLDGIIITNYLRWLIESDYSPSTAKSRRTVLLTIWRHAYRNRYNSHDPSRFDVPTPRETKQLPKAWSIGQIQQMLDRCDQITPRDHIVFHGVHWRALIQLLYYTGLRIQTAILLPRTALKGHLLLVPAELQKDDEEQSFRLPNEIVSLLVSLPRPAETCHGRYLPEMLIPWPWRMDNASRRLTYWILRPAGLPMDSKLKFHAFRRTVATLVNYHSGLDAARKTLGHSCSDTTRRYLADPVTVDPSLQGHLSPADVLPSLKTG